MVGFVEAQQFKGVWPDPVKKAMADSELSKPRDQRDPPFNTPEGEIVLHSMQQPPPFDGKVSLYFKGGVSFDIQLDHETGQQYLVLPREPGRTRVRAYVGDWVCQLPSGNFIKLSDQDYKALTNDKAPMADKASAAA